MIRLDNLTWKKNSELIKKKIGPENIVEIVESQQGKTLNAWDIVFINPDFDEINDGDPIPLYSFSFVTGKFQRVE